MKFNEDYRQKIIDDHPNLYRNDIYFECGDGWLSIIEELSKKLEHLILYSDHPAQFYCEHVKEKHGTLRFYMSEMTEEMMDEIEFATLQSLQTCEVCGNPGNSANAGWIKTRCKEHK